MRETIILSILQGVAEFLPISSSGHLVLGRNLLGLGDVGMRLDICLHVGTLLAVFAFYFSVIRRIVLGREWSYLAKIVLSAIPAGLVGVLFSSRIEAAFSSPHTVGVALLFTGVILTATRFLPKRRGEITYSRALWIGLAQAIAILPGVSRSGMTLAAARLTGVEAERSAEFSFLMSAPPIVGAAMLEIAKSCGNPSIGEVPWVNCLVGALLAAVVGYFSLKLLVRSLKGRWFWLFGPYCILAGVLTIWRISANV